jgi:hypothetical protein
MTGSQRVMPTPPIEAAVSARARAIASGLVRTARAAPGSKLDRGLLRLACFAGGFYWISLDGSRMLRGIQLFDAEELQPKFIDAMERASR